MKMMNKSEPRTDPWRVPLSPSLHPDKWPFSHLAPCILSFNLLSIHGRSFPSVLWERGFYKRLWWGTLLKASLKSKCVMPTGSPLCTCLFTLGRFAQEHFPLQNPCRLYPRRSYLSMWLLTSFYYRVDQLTRGGSETRWSVVPTIISRALSERGNTPILWHTSHL